MIASRGGDPLGALRFAKRQAMLRPKTANWTLVASMAALHSEWAIAESAAREAIAVAATDAEVAEATELLAKIQAKRSR